MEAIFQPFVAVKMFQIFSRQFGEISWRFTQDFFQFSCGGWLKKNPIPESKSRWTQFDIINDELTAFLRSKSIDLYINL